MRIKISGTLARGAAGYRGCGLRAAGRELVVVRLGAVNRDGEHEEITKTATGHCVAVALRGIAVAEACAFRVVVHAKVVAHLVCKDKRLPQERCQ